MRQNNHMSKKIDASLKDLIKALRKHADAVGGSRVSLKKSQRAGAKLQATATAYAAAVHAKTGLDSPFNDVVSPGLENVTLNSLLAERDALAKNKAKSDSEKAPTSL
jgi:predicted NACHT family NTPase